MFVPPLCKRRDHPKDLKIDSDRPMASVGSAFKEGPKRTDWAPEENLVDAFVGDMFFLFFFLLFASFQSLPLGQTQSISDGSPGSTRSFLAYLVLGSMSSRLGDVRE